MNDIDEKEYKDDNQRVIFLSIMYSSYSFDFDLDFFSFSFSNDFDEINDV